MNEIKMGIYRHYKGPLYQVFGIGHDANADSLVPLQGLRDKVDTAQLRRDLASLVYGNGGAMGSSDVVWRLSVVAATMLGLLEDPHDRNERIVVLYIGLQLSGAHLGPRWSVRTLQDAIDDFTSTVCGQSWCPAFGSADFLGCPDNERKHEVARFTYLGPWLTEDMLHV